MGLQILIVDDNENISTLLNDVVSLEDYTGVVAHDGESAKSAIDKNDFDVAFCDLTLPDISGWEVVEYLRETAPETKIIVISGMGDSIEKDKLEEHQVEYTVHKPFQITDVQEVLREL
ncbi:MAG: Transcriptional regulatory protein TcrA [Candidatus Marinimicrobia bacterium]|nr:Transcriptional regulatory protein TcrA [Candidatus Neomarinimicrobiota bacterium]